MTDNVIPIRKDNRQALVSLFASIIRDNVEIIAGHMADAESHRVTIQYFKMGGDEGIMIEKWVPA